MHRRRTPQEKKALSLRKDRRNTYGENDKASRRAIPLAKARVNRANRQADRRLLALATGSTTADDRERTESKVAGRRRKVWRKQPDQPLGVVLARRRSPG